MCIRNTHERYGAVAQGFHWLLAAMIVGMIAVGYVVSGMQTGPEKFKLMGLHKAVGMMVLLLALLRFAWRLCNAQPEAPPVSIEKRPRLAAIEHLAARIAHWALYALMFAMPVSGWVMSSAAGFPVSVFGWFTMPDLVVPDKDLLATMRAAHGTLAIALIALMALHAGAALMHHFYYKNDVLKRMLPGWR